MLTPTGFRKSFLLCSLIMSMLVGCGDGTALVRNLPAPPSGPQRQSSYYRPQATYKPAPEQLVVARAASTRVPNWLPGVKERKWRFIVVHHSATDKGSAAFFDRVHRSQGWTGGLGYHFTIGNGTMGVADGQIELGPRWREQNTGAHCRVRGRPEFNEVGIGICLVGNFNNGKPSEAQMRSLAALIQQLQGRYSIPKSRIHGHGSLKATDCPGKQFDINDLYRRL